MRGLFLMSEVPLYLEIQGGADGGVGVVRDDAARARHAVQERRALSGPHPLLVEGEGLRG